MNTELREWRDPAVLWVIGSIVNIFTKFWTGSFIDYRTESEEKAFQLDSIGQQHSW